MQSSSSNSDLQTSYCLCTLAIGLPYRIAAQKLASDIKDQGIELIVATDYPSDFYKYSNVKASKVTRTSIQYAYNDKRLALAAALEYYDCVVLVDADSQIINELPKTINARPGLTGMVKFKNLKQDLIEYHNNNVQKFQQLAKKLNVELDKCQWINEDLLILRKDQGKELEFLEQWDFVDRWLGLRKIFQGDAAFIGLAAAAVGWQVSTNNSFFELKKVIKNEKIGREKGTRRASLRNKSFKNRINFHKRMAQSFLYSLKDIKKYYF